MRCLALLLLLAAPAFAESFAYVIEDGARIDAPLGGLVGDAARGAALAAAEDPGCLSCHQGAALALDKAAARLEPGALRLALVALPLTEPEVDGHAFYDPLDPEESVDENSVGETPLTAQQIEDLMAWLEALNS